MERGMESGGFFFNPSSHADVLFLGKAADSPFPGGSWSVMKMEESLKRRPTCLFSAPQSLVCDDEEYYEEQSSSDKKRRLTSQQVEVLEKSFSGGKKLEGERKKELASNLGLQPRQVAVWFQNRRARWKAKQLERDYVQLKSSHDYLLCHYNFILKQNQMLKAEVNLLSKKLEGNCKEVDDDDAPRMKVVEEECGSPKQQQQQLMDNYYYYCVGGTWKTYNNNNNNNNFHNEDYEDMDHHVCNSLPHAQTTTDDDDEPLGWFWS
ncbi:homeobox-leucine zipper protein HAT5-like [Ipomoea triloba]|uniref:homeobox-leucine zipper protein HAT5-like n=1 Tax=Ipomoea triloba TaxID=35885 RepID=UPI00125E1C53|nr:homeobox-leucine zipper protein HAT5-like [Ipomoea triloba]